MTAQYSRDVACTTAAHIVAGTAAALYTLVAARLLGPQDFGLFQALMALYAVLMSGGALLGCKALHRVASTAPEERGAALAKALRPALFAGLVAGMFVIGATPWLTHRLRCAESAATWMLAAVVTVAFVLTTLYGGIQGFQRYRCYAGVKIMESLLYVSAGTVLLSVGAGVSGAIAGYAIAMTVAVVVLLGRSGIERRAVLRPGQNVPARSGGTLLLVYVTMFFVINVPAVVARVRLPDDQAGLFAVLYAMRNAVVPFALAAGVPLYAHRVALGAQPGRIRQAIAVVVGASLMVLAASCVCPRWLITLLCGPAYAGAAPYMASYAMFLLLHGVMMVLLMQGAAAAVLPVGVVLVPLLVTLCLAIIPELTIPRIILVQSTAWIAAGGMWLGCLARAWIHARCLERSARRCVP